jgi:hypothetical protein
MKSDMSYEVISRSPDVGTPHEGVSSIFDTQAYDYDNQSDQFSLGGATPADGLSLLPPSLKGSFALLPSSP